MPKTSLQTLASTIGRIGQLRTSEGLYVDVEIIDVKPPAYGNVRYIVRPVSGTQHTATVDSTRVTLIEAVA